ncbi:MAG TPA: hypothetical protein VJ729_14155 [Nitrososphaeraceae archaeon]|jgi:Na+/melibiose symporter-like transporter|nr:hypothetical protein [Nitrososphaeraceae archaeon]
MNPLIPEAQKENEGDYKKLNKRLETLLDQFENEVKSYDKWSSISMLASPVGIIISIFLPILFIQYVSHGNPYVSINSSPALYLVFSGIVATVVITKLAIFYVDYKKHEVSNTKYRPIAGVCMCDLSQLRTHMIKIEKSKTAGERMRHVRLMNYYKRQIGWL